MSGQGISSGERFEKLSPEKARLVQLLLDRRTNLHRRFYLAAVQGVGGSSHRGHSSVCGLSINSRGGTHGI